MDFFFNYISFVTTICQLFIIVTIMNFVYNFKCIGGNKQHTHILLFTKLRKRFDKSLYANFISEIVSETRKFNFFMHFFDEL